MTARMLLRREYRAWRSLDRVERWLWGGLLACVLGSFACKVAVLVLMTWSCFR